MRISDRRSIMIILVYVAIQTGIIAMSLKQNFTPLDSAAQPSSVAPEFTLIENLGYFHLRNGIPQMSLAADQMRSQGEEFAEFFGPKGVYNYQERNESLRYQAQKGTYEKAKEYIHLIGEVKVVGNEAQYYADTLDYFFKQDLLTGAGNVKFEGDDLKTKDHFTVQAERLRAHPHQKIGTFSGAVNGVMQRKKKYEGAMKFKAQTLDLDGFKSFAHLENDVEIKREAYLITAGKADIYFDNYNKSLKYFVLNDDVKVTEKLNTPQGVVTRKAFSERLEGFGREQKMVLSGAPKVETGSDVIKGYRITIREQADLIEVDDAMSDVQVKRKN